MSLKGKRIVVTRAVHQSESLADLLREKAAIPILYPCIAICPPDDSSDLDHALTHLEDFDYLLITSPNTVYAIQQRLQTLNKYPDFSRLKIAAVGENSSEAIAEYWNVDVFFVSDVQTGESLAETLPIVNNARIFLPQSGLAGHEVAQILESRGAIVTHAIAYENHIGTGGEDVPSMLQTGELDALTFTSNSTVKNFLRRIAPQTAYEIPVVVIGSSTAKTAEEAGFKNIIMPGEYNLEKMIEALENYFENL